MFITFEGGEGVGKSTQVRRLVAHLQASGRRVIATREPGGSAKAEVIRGLLLSGAAAPLGTSAEAILFSAARIDHLATTIRPALTRGDCVVCDRFLDSTAAYQGVLGHVPAVTLRMLAQVAVGSTRPDLTFMLDLPADVGLARARSRAGRDAAPDRFERQSPAFHDRLRQAFCDIAAADPVRCLVVDASQDADAVASTVWDAVVARLAAKAWPDPA